MESAALDAVHRQVAVRGRDEEAGVEEEDGVLRFIEERGFGVGRQCGRGARRGRSANPLIGGYRQTDIEPVDGSVARLAEVEAEQGGMILEGSRTITVMQRGEDRLCRGPMKPNGVLCFADVGK